MGTSGRLLSIIVFVLAAFAVIDAMWLPYSRVHLSAGYPSLIMKIVLAIAVLHIPRLHRRSSTVGHNDISQSQ